MCHHLYSLLVLKYLTLSTKIAGVVEVWELMCRELMEDQTLLRLKVLSLLALLVQKVQILTLASEARVCAWIYAGRNVEHRAASYALVLDYSVYLLYWYKNYECLLWIYAGRNMEHRAASYALVLDYTCFTGTKITNACCMFWYSVYLLYWSRSTCFTSTKVRVVWMYAGRNTEHRAASYALVLNYSVYLLYWYKITNA